MTANSNNGKKLDLPPVFNDEPPPQPQIRATRQLLQTTPDGREVPLGPPQEVTPKPISDDEWNAKAKGGAVKQKSWQRALTQHQQIRRRSTAAVAARLKPKGNW